MGNELIKPRSFKDLVQSDNVKGRLKEILGDRGNQFAVALTQIVNGSWQLQKCDPASILGAALTAASLDLSCDPNLGEAHLVPYGDKCQFQIGFKGFIQLAMRTKQYKALGSAPIYEGELVSYDRLTGELVLDSSRRESDTVIGYAAKFKLVTGFERAEYWTVDEIEKHALRYSKAYKFAKGKPDKEANCLWVTDRDKMALKTVEKSLLSHYGPKSIQMATALSVDGGAVVNADKGEVEYIDTDQPQKLGHQTKPEFDEPAKDKEAEVVEKPKTQQPEKVLKSAKPEGLNKRKAIRGMMELKGIEEADLLKHVTKVVNIDAGETLEQTPDDVVDLIYGDIDTLVESLKK